MARSDVIQGFVQRGISQPAGVPNYRPQRMRGQTLSDTRRDASL